MLYFRPPAGRRDTGIYEYGHPERGGGGFKYNVIRVYALEGEAFLDPEALGLLPFTALMKPPADLTAEINAILAAEFCQDLLSPILQQYEDEKARIQQKYPTLKTPKKGDPS